MDGVNVAVPVSEKMAEWLAQVEREGDVGEYVRRLIKADMRDGGRYREPTELEKARAAARALKAGREAERQAHREASR